MKSFIAKWVISILVNFRYLRFKLLKYKDNNQKICDTFYHNFRYTCTFMYNELGTIRKGIILYYTIVPLLWKCQNWCLTRFAMKLFIPYTCFHMMFGLTSLACNPNITTIGFIRMHWENLNENKYLGYFYSNSQWTSHPLSYEWPTSTARSDIIKLFAFYKKNIWIDSDSSCLTLKVPELTAVWTLCVLCGAYLRLWHVKS